MTSLAFILGVHAAGDRHRRRLRQPRTAIGIGVMGGMIAATVLGIFFVPLFFVSISWLTTKWSGRRQDSGRPHTTEA